MDSIFRVYVGPIGVDEIADRIDATGIARVTVRGTEHLHVSVATEKLRGWGWIEAARLLSEADAKLSLLNRSPLQKAEFLRVSAACFVADDNGAGTQFCKRCGWTWNLHTGDFGECPAPGSINIGGN
jgi:hypothetical protein